MRSPSADKLSTMPSGRDSSLGGVPTMGSVRSFEGMSIMSGAVSGEDDTLLGPTEGLQARIVHPHRMPTMVALNAASILEKSDEQLLPSVYKYVGCSLKKATPARLATITSSRAMCQAVASGLGGYLGHVYDRSVVTAVGCFIWGTTTLLFSMTSSVGWGAFTWAWNGVGLSFIIPNSQSLVADYYSDADRGKAFGTLYTTGALGGMLGALYATNIAGYSPLNMEGWRVAFRTVAVAAFVIGFVVLYYVKDPRNPSKSQTIEYAPLSAHGLRDSREGSLMREVKEESWREVTQISTFRVIIFQGILGSTPWNALVFMTVYLQLIGFSDASASLVNSCFLAGAALGGVLGGFVGDWAASMNSDHGRILACQFSVSMGIPFTIVLLKCLPFNGEPLTVAIYGVLMFFFGLLHVWAAPACNNPVFAEIVPPHLRNLVYAFDRSFEGALAALGAPLVGIIAEKIFHFPHEATIECDAATHKPLAARTARDHEKGIALGNAMLVCMLVPWTLCLLVYTLLHCTYPKDKRRAASWAARSVDNLRPTSVDVR